MDERVGEIIVAALRRANEKLAVLAASLRGEITIGEMYEFKRTGMILDEEPEWKRAAKAHGARLDSRSANGEVPQAADAAR